MSYSSTWTTTPFLKANALLLCLCFASVDWFRRRRRLGHERIDGRAEPAGEYAQPRVLLARHHAAQLADRRRPGSMQR